MSKNKLIVIVASLFSIQAIVTGTVFYKEFTKDSELRPQIQKTSYVQAVVNCGSYNLIVDTAVGVVLVTEKVVDADGSVVLKVPESTRIAFGTSGAVIDCTNDEVVVSTIASEQRFSITRR